MGREISCYTQEFPTITRISEIKQTYESLVLASIGNYVSRISSEENLPLLEPTLSLSQSGNQALAIDLQFHYVPLAFLTGQEKADAVFILVNATQPQEEFERVRENISSVGKMPVFLIMTCLEKQKIFWESEYMASSQGKYYEAVRQEWKLPDRDGDYVAFVQLYGGLEFLEYQEEKLLFRTVHNCREYLPVACHLPIFYAIKEIVAKRNLLKEMAVSEDVAQLMQMLDNIYASMPKIQNVCKKYLGGKEEFETHEE